MTTATKSRIIALADAVVDLLNGHEFAVEFRAERAYKPERNPEQLRKLRAFVIPASYTGEFINRARTTQDDQVVDVGLLKHLASQDDSEADDLMALVDEVADFLVGTSANDFNHVTAGDLIYTLVKPPESPVIFLPDDLRDKRIFASVLRLTYRAGRSR